MFYYNFYFQEVNVDLLNKLRSLISMPSRYYVVLVSVYFTFALNYLVLYEYSALLLSSEKPDYAVLFTLPIIIFCLMLIVFSLISWRYVGKVLIPLLTVFSAVVLFGTKEYGIIFDHTMFQNFYETDTSESLTYVNLASVLFVLFVGILPALAFLNIKVQYKKPLSELKDKAIIMIASLLIIATIVFVFYQNYASFVRNNEQFKRSIIPTYYLSSLFKFINVEFLTKPQEYLILGADAVQEKPVAMAKNNLVVFVLGETARAMNFTYNGYDKDTTPFTREFEPISFQNVTSCGTTTAVSVPCMFSHMNREDYNGNRAKSADNVVDIIARAGVDTKWIDNNSGCKGVCNRIPAVQIPVKPKSELCDGFYCLDAILLDELQSELAISTDNDKLIILHMIGSHGPTYYRRYPAEFRKFTPDCQRSDIQNCSNEELVNTYDNTIYYTDHILAETIKLLNAASDKYNVSLLYVSDHGESLGENGVYLHGIPYYLAPKEQTNIPMLLWMNNSFAIQNELSHECLAKQANKNNYSHDNVFHSLLGLMHVKTSIYSQELDLFSACKSR